MLEKVLIFLLFLGPLIFFHELGHFLFARLFGVRVEVFSIGFGPKILKMVRGGTEYTLSIIPLGGYIKMFGDDPLNATELTPEEKKVAFTHKSKWARFWIVFGGPLANFILAYVIFVGICMHGEKMPQVSFGQISQESIYYKAGVRPGDIIKAANDFQILSFDDFALVPKNINKLVIERDKKIIEINQELDGEVLVNDFTKMSSLLMAPIYYNDKGELFGLSLNKDKFDVNYPYEKLVNATGVIYVHQLENQTNPEYLSDIKPLKDSKPLELYLDKNQTLDDVLAQKMLIRNDLYIQSVMMKGPADIAGLKSRDMIVAVNGNKVVSFGHFRDEVQKTKKDSAIDLEILRQGKLVNIKIIPEVKIVNKEEVMSIGIQSGAMMLPPAMIDVKGRSFLDSIGIGFVKTWDAIYKTLLGFQKIVMGEVALNNLGGPIAIAKVASDTFSVGFGIFLRFMAMISVNLGVINLFPIPVLDGGHIVFLALEAVNRGPLSRKKLQIAQQIGMSLLFVLIFVALYNDISRLIN